MVSASPSTRRVLERARALPPRLNRLARRGAAGKRLGVLWPAVALAYLLILLLFVVLLPPAVGVALAVERAVNYLALAAVVAAGVRDYRARRRTPRDTPVAAGQRQD